MELINNKWINRGYALRYIVPVRKFNEFISDPDDNDITEVKWTSLEDFGKYIGWLGKTYEYMRRELPRLIKNTI